MDTTRKLAAEFIGTFWLILGGCGAALLAASLPGVGIGYIGIGLAFGLIVMCGAFAVGHISGAHFNPAVTVGMVVGGRMATQDAVGYVVAQVLGGILGAAVLYVIASGAPAFDASASFASTGYGAHSPQNFSLTAGLITEIVMTFMFLFVIIGATSDGAPKGFAPIAIGLALTAIHLMSLPVTGTSVNPARSTATAVFQGGWALQQLWLFWVAPLIGGALGGVAGKWLWPK